MGMIGVNRERDSSRGVTVSLFGGGINPADEIPAGIDADYIAEFSQAHEASGFDKVLIGYSSATAEGFAVAGYAASQTKTLGYLIAHRPGFVFPTLLARQAATLDQLTEGRIALHIISGGSDLEQRRDGDWSDHVGAGAVIYVDAHVAHRFHTITEDLSVIVVFAPPRRSLAVQS